MSKQHPRNKIRNFFTENLKEKTLAKENVFNSRSMPLFEQHLPAILVYSRDERILETNYDGDGQMAYKRELEVSIEGVIGGSEKMDDELDTLSFEIEETIKDFEIPEFLNSVIKLKSTESDVSMEGAKSFGAIRLNYTVTYYT